MDIDKAVNGYFAKRKELEESWSRPSKLSDVILKLATYLSYIGDSTGLLKEQYEAERAKSYLKHLNDGKSASNAENLARCETAEIRGQVNKFELMLKTGLTIGRRAFGIVILGFGIGFCYDVPETLYGVPRKVIWK